MDRDIVCAVALTGSLGLLVAALQGCAGAATRADELSVTSEPPAAEVYAMGERLGVTPLTIRQEAVFPVVYDRDREPLYGKLMLRKDGCREHTQRVSSAALHKGVVVKLDCGQPAAKEAVEKLEAPPRAAQTPALRLRRLDALHREGLISDEEYHTIRERILSEL